MPSCKSFFESQLSFTADPSSTTRQELYNYLQGMFGHADALTWCTKYLRELPKHVQWEATALSLFIPFICVQMSSIYSLWNHFVIRLMAISTAIPVHTNLRYVLATHSARIYPNRHGNDPPRTTGGGRARSQSVSLNHVPCFWIYTLNRTPKKIRISDRNGYLLTA